VGTFGDVTSDNYFIDVCTECTTNCFITGASTGNDLGGLYLYFFYFYVLIYYLWTELYSKSCVNCGEYGLSDCESGTNSQCSWIDGTCKFNPCKFESTPCLSEHCILDQENEGL
jgi:hypothetical protein